MNKKLFASFCIILFAVMAFKIHSFADYYNNSIVLKSGMRNNDVKKLQSDLKLLGYFSYTPTGYFGSLTKNSVINYQKNNQLLIDGLVGRNTAREIKIDLVLNMAKKYLGVPYVWGGVSPKGFDCSGFTHYVLLKNDIIIPRTSAQQYKTGTWIPKNKLKPGDLVFFETYKKGASHVGFYLGNNKFIHASSGGKRVIISNLTKSYYVSHYYGAKRMIN